MKGQATFRLRTISPPIFIEVFRHLRDRVTSAKNHFFLQQELQDRPAWRNAVAGVAIFFRKGKTILFFPERTPREWMAYECCVYLGYRIIKDPTRPFDVAFKRANRTVFNSAQLDTVPRKRSEIINSGCSDISKRRVGRVFADIFGYTMDVDPLTYEGPMLSKSDANGAHDGKILHSPISPELVRRSCVYQKLIDSQSFHEGYYLDYRVMICAGRILFVLLKHRPEDQRFTYYDFPEIKKPEDIFSAEEMEKLRMMVREMELDFGDMDVLRDRDGRIYVVDVNNTPMSHTCAMPIDQKRRFVELMAEPFKQLIAQYS